MRTFYCICFLFFLLSGCSTIDITQYRNNSPQLDMFSFFQGETKGWGIVQDRNGNLKRYFTVDITGTVEENGDLVLDEKFHWNDGEQSTRIWRITKTDDAMFRGYSDDAISPANGVISGNTMNWKYQLLLKLDDSSWKITFDDWMFLIEENVLINKAAMSKFGIHLGDVTISFSKHTL